MDLHVMSVYFPVIPTYFNGILSDYPGIPREFFPVYFAGRTRNFMIFHRILLAVQWTPRNSSGFRRQFNRFPIQFKGFIRYSSKFQLYFRGFHCSSSKYHWDSSGYLSFPARCKCSRFSWHSSRFHRHSTYFSGLPVDFLDISRDFLNIPVDFPDILEDFYCISGHYLRILVH